MRRAPPRSPCRPGRPKPGRPLPLVEEDAARSHDGPRPTCHATESTGGSTPVRAASAYQRALDFGVRSSVA
ncbi:hypothetical protein S1361_15325 [Streptomyces cyanogenus]|uniref:Uncharacterized protein n=1 Tax=Streptomyces cyanogenus TaxID=80860 RepID=A0ABX7TQR6_STRCY|nr:hypothetical protein S1361_15325 [Streptomyces cyanogenus]